LHGKRYQLPHRGGIVHNKERFNHMKHPSLLFNSRNFFTYGSRELNDFLSTSIRRLQKLFPCYEDL
jgi:hypothetical protein